MAEENDTPKRQGSGDWSGTYAKGGLIMTCRKCKTTVGGGAKLKCKTTVGGGAKLKCKCDDMKTETSCALSVGSGPDLKLGTMPVRGLGRRAPALRKRRRKQPLESPVSQSEYAMGQLTTDVKPFQKAESLPVSQFLAETFGYVSLELEKITGLEEKVLEQWETQSLDHLTKLAERHLNLCAEVLLREDAALGRVKLPETIEPAFKIVRSESSVHVFTRDPQSGLRNEIASLFPYPALPPQSTVEEAVNKITKIAQPSL